MSADFALRLLRFWSLLFAAVGLSWVIVGSFDPFGIYDSFLADALFERDALPDDAARTWRLGVGIIGALTVSVFVLFYFVVRHALPTGEPWAYRALWAALLTWFVPDSAVSLMVGATFNVVAVNIPCLLLVGGTLYAWRRAARP